MHIYTKNLKMNLKKKLYGKYLYFGTISVSFGSIWILLNNHLSSKSVYKITVKNLDNTISKTNLKNLNSITLKSNLLDVSSHEDITSFCNINQQFLRQMVYLINPPQKETISFMISVHDPIQDHVISKGILDHGTYPSVDEFHTICIHSSKNKKYNFAESYSMECENDKLFVEVGSAIGMVSLYAASRGMRVHAFDPILPNIDRLSESRCFNGVSHCMHQENTTSKKLCLSKNLNWGNFSLNRLNLHWSFVSSNPEIARYIESKPQNLAATAGGGGNYNSMVNVTSLNAVFQDPVDIEIMLLTCQGFEYEVLKGASNMLKSKQIKNIIWRRHPSQNKILTPVIVLGKTYMLSREDFNTAKLAEMLIEYGYNFYNIEKCKKQLKPTWIHPSSLMDYILQPLYNGDHPNIFSSLNHF